MPTATTLIEWKAAYEVGHLEIDSQHKRLVQIMNRLYEAMSQGQGRAVLGRTLDELVAYTKAHFAAEERLMQAKHYADFAQHKAKHDALASQVMHHYAEFKQNRGNVLQVMQFLKTWLLDHIAQQDSAFVKTIR